MHWQVFGGGAKSKISATNFLSVMPRRTVGKVSRGYF